MSRILCCSNGDEAGLLDCGNIADTIEDGKDAAMLRRTMRKEEEKREHAASIVRQNDAMMHGILTVKIIAGRDLPNTDFSILKKDLTDAYVTVDTYFEGKETARICKTSVVDDDLNPVWDETYHISLCHAVDDFRFAIKDKDQLRNEVIGEFVVRADDVKRSGGVRGWHRINRRGGARGAGELNIDVTFASARSVFDARSSAESSGAAANEVPGTYFPVRTGCRVKLYQDAHTPAVPPVTDVTATDGSGPYAPPCLWEDTLEAINEARKFVYVVGWAVWDQLLLLRSDAGGHSDYSETLGELLKRKAAAEGVKVCIMAWEEKLSTDVSPCGLMGTHDHTMRNWFNENDSNCAVFLCPRMKKKADRIMESAWVETTYTHHQKCVICDAPAPDDGTKRRLVCFMGGIDLTDGRWDTPAHELYRTLPNEHRADFYNGTAPTATVECGPRQPWHDIHLYAEGGVAFDLVKNFHERWLCQNSKYPQCLYQDVFTEFGAPDDPVPTAEEDGDRVWNAQLFRSINMDSADFEPSAARDGRLTHRKGRIFDDSIQRAYIHHIRKAEKFIYIENQYFLGSCFGWKVPETTKCTHLVPMEICTRIEAAIEDGRDFRVYVTVPLQPEGDPTSAAVQEVLRWQYRTLEMMYRRIGRAIEKRGLKGKVHPRDYLAVFCLTKRDSPDDVPESLQTPPRNSVMAKCRESLRFMIYVHSKFAIFDDEYVIVGSANINERSMSGNRDTELAMGAWQPAYSVSSLEGDEDTPAGDVRTFRLALWAEHCGSHMEEHLRPSSKGCVDAMNALGSANLVRFMGDVVERNDSHLTTYPLEVDGDGHVDEMEECKTFPDLGGSIKGRNSMFLPNSVTT